MYQPRRTSRSEFVPIRRSRYHVRIWGEPQPGRVPLVMVHGWMDVSASYQFVVDAFSREHYVIAPDWRGYGLTESPPADNYWFPDYLADLDFLLDHYAGDAAGAPGRPQHGRPDRHAVHRRPPAARAQAGQPGRLRHAGHPPAAGARALCQVDGRAQGAATAASWTSRATTRPRASRARLMKTNRRLAQRQGRVAGPALGARRTPTAAGASWATPRTRSPTPSCSGWTRCWRSTSASPAPTLWVEAADDSLAQWWQGRFTLAEFHERLAAVSNLSKARVEDAGHMFHHDQPAGAGPADRGLPRRLKAARPHDGGFDAPAASTAGKNSHFAYMSVRQSPIHGVGDAPTPRLVAQRS